MKYWIMIRHDEDGKIVASCPALPGCWSQGDTREEAERNIEDAVEGYLESLKKHGDPIPARA
jgi:predicted RNase H-like HicB family nuclease